MDHRSVSLLLERRTMSQKQRLKAKVRQFDHPDLLTKCEPVAEGDDVAALEAEMRKVLKAHWDGIGLAAPQIGHLVRAILITRNARIPTVEFFINPEIISMQGNPVYWTEGCLSYPRTECPVMRAPICTMKHRGGEEQFQDYEAAIVQHEIDHLNGVCRVGDHWRKQNELAIQDS